MGTLGTLAASVKKRATLARVDALGMRASNMGALGPLMYICMFAASIAWLYVTADSSIRPCAGQVMHRPNADHSASRAKAASIRCIASIASTGVPGEPDTSLLLGGTSPAILAVSPSKKSSAFLL
jgi:hypothetical protein